MQWYATCCKKKKQLENVIETTFLTGPFEGEAVLIPRIPMIPTDMPFQLKRLQFPIRLVFAITINKAQGQSLEKRAIIRKRAIEILTQIVFPMDNCLLHTVKKILHTIQKRKKH